MLRNITNQSIGAQMVDAANGSAFTGTVTVYITGDAGVQALGSVGAGVCTHEGNGYHTYTPSQAETNYDLVAFTFTGTGAIPQTIQVETLTTAQAASLSASTSSVTGQTLLDYMEILFPELENQSGESDVTKSLLALNIAQDAFESLVAQEPALLGGQVGTLLTTANQEYSTYPTGLLRLDRLQYLSPSTGLPVKSLTRLSTPGDHGYTTIWPGNLVSVIGSGIPSSYWTNGTRIYWAPTPNSSLSTIRYYGFLAADDITAAGAFAYQDIAAFPVASVAARIIRTGLDDSTTDLSGLAKSLLGPAIDALKQFNRDGAVGYRYAYTHRT